MNPQSIDEFMEYILALKNGFGQEKQQLLAQIKNLQEEIKNLKVTSKPLKEIPSSDGSANFKKSKN